MACAPKNTEKAWVVESVAVSPEFRRQVSSVPYWMKYLKGAGRMVILVLRLGPLLTTPLPDWPMRNKDFSSIVKKEILSLRLFLAPGHSQASAWSLEQ